MNKIAIAFSTKDRVELSKQSIEPLLRPDKFDLAWVDGSNTKEGETLPHQYRVPPLGNIYNNVRGGADAAIVFALPKLLEGKNHYDYVGLCENDVLLDPDWFEPTMELFDKGAKDGLAVGAASARCYADRVLVQRDGYAVCHNLGAGHVIFTRHAAELVLKYFRTGWTLENRRAFAQLSGLDIGPFWAFRGEQHMLCADWQFDRILAQHGLCSLALTPAKCRMIGQEPPLEQQGLTLVDGPVEERHNDKAFDTFVERTELVRNGHLKIPVSLELVQDEGTRTFFPHQVPYLGGGYEGDWRLKWTQGFGPFSWMADGECEVSIPLSGAVTVLLSGGKEGGKVRLIDEASGYDMEVEMPPDVDMTKIMAFNVPTAVSYRNVRIVPLNSGITFYGLITRESQPLIAAGSFDHSWLAKT